MLKGIKGCLGAWGMIEVIKFSVYAAAVCKVATSDEQVDAVSLLSLSVAI